MSHVVAKLVIGTLVAAFAAFPAADFDSALGGAYDPCSGDASGPCAALPCTESITTCVGPPPNNGLCSKTGGKTCRAAGCGGARRNQQCAGAP
jgi:hypothetical protein